MRSFPSSARRRLLATSLAAAAIGGLFTTSAAHADHGHVLKHRQHQVQRQEKQARESLDGASRDLVSAQQALASAQRQLVAARQHLETVSGQLAAARAAHLVVLRQLAASRARLAQVNSAAIAGAASVNRMLEAARATILQSYSTGDPRIAEAQALVSGTSLDELALQQSYTAAAGQLQANGLQELQSSEVLLEVRRQDVARVTAAIAEQERQAAAKVAQIKQLQQQAIAARDTVAGLVRSRRTAEAEAAAIKSRDSGKLANLQKQEASIERKILALSAHDVNRTVATTNSMFLPPVANSYITSPYGWRIHPIFHYWGLHDGDDLAAPCGTPEVAVATGRVISEYYSSVWGNRLYFDIGNINGHNYVAIYNHISAYRTHVGEVVGRGQTLALAGTTGWSTGCHLHFTIMRDGVAIDPTKLIGM